MSTRGQFDDLLRDIEPSPTVPALVEGLRDTDQGVRLLAARALEQLEAVAVPAQIPALIVAVGDRDLCVRRVAMRMLGQMGPNASAAVPALISAVQDAYEEVRSAAARALGQIGQVAMSALPALTEAETSDTNVQVREQAAWAIRTIRGDQV